MREFSLFSGRVFIVFFFSLWISNSFAEIYKQVDKSGHVSFGNVAPAGQSKEGRYRNNKRVVRPDVSPIRTTAGPAFVAADVPAYDGSIILNVRRLLQEQRYEALNILLDKYQKQFEQNSLLEERLFSAYAAFDVVDQGYASLLDAWVNQTPDIYQPYLARANYYYNKGWHERGGDWLSETEKQQISLMKVSFKKAMKDAEIAETLNSESIMPYHIMSSISHTEGNEGLAGNYKSARFLETLYRLNCEHIM